MSQPQRASALLCCLLLTSCGSGDTPVAPPSTTTQAPDSTPPPSAPPPSGTTSAGPDQAVRVGTTATITGSLSSGLPVCWTLASKPVGSLSTIGTTNQPLVVTLKPDKPGLYTVQLGCAGQSTDEAVITALINLVALHFEGAFSTGDPVVCDFSYDSTEQPIATNIRGRSPNALYTLKAWDCTVKTDVLSSLDPSFPPNTYKNGEGNGSAQFCVGSCIFSTDILLDVQFFNDSPFFLHLVFTDNGTCCTTPDGFNGWGPFRFAEYRVPNGQVAILNDEYTLTTP